MKVKEIVEMYKGEFVEVETYFSLNRSHSFHTDSIIAAGINQDGDPEINL